MKSLLIFLALTHGALFAQNITPKAFSGLWYEIARTYNDYEKNCVAATVEYRLSENERFDVTNRCFDSKIGGDLIVYNGTAKPLVEGSASKLSITYFWVFSREYHIIHWDERYAVMASPDFVNVWIMSRTPRMPQSKLDAIVKKLSTRIDTSKLIYTPQDKQGRYL